MNAVTPAPVPTALFRQIRPGFERLAPGLSRPRHAHLCAYASIVLDGQYDQASYAGRMRLEPGDVLIQPVLDRHETRILRNRELRLLRLAWFPEQGVGDVYRVPGLDLVIGTAQRDPKCASALLLELLPRATRRPAMIKDWPDLLAAELRNADTPIVRWAQAHQLARETVSRGFFRAYGVSPRTFAAELKARQAWIHIVSRHEGLAKIASDLGYADHPHMTRAVRALTGAPPDAWRRHLSCSKERAG